MAKTQYSFSDNPNALGAPENFEITIRELVPKLGAGFIVALTGDVMTMPGTSKTTCPLSTWMLKVMELLLDYSSSNTKDNLFDKVVFFNYKKTPRKILGV